MTSFKDMIKAGDIKRADAMKVRFADLHVEPGFNVRLGSPELEAHIEEITAYILAGGVLPPLEVRPREEGGVWIVDGHCRTAAYGRAIERGAPIEWIDVRGFQGNDVDRVARIATSNEGLKLSQLEVALLYKRLRGMGNDVPQIAKLVNKTRQYVEAALKLADANKDVQEMVATGKVSPSVAVQSVRKHGEKAGDALKGQLQAAEAKGVTKLTKSVVAAPKPAWHDKPTTPGLWAFINLDDETKTGVHKISEQDITRAIGGFAWFGPLPARKEGGAQ